MNLDRLDLRISQKALTLGLPSEAQWEYACLAGTTTATFAGALEIVGDANAPGLDPIAWYAGNSGVDFELDNGVDILWASDPQYPKSPSGTHPVCQKLPNPWGIENMLGNVFEWCADTWHDSFEGAPADGSPWIDDTSTARVIRGGSWVGDARVARSAFRRGCGPGFRFRCLGFRCAGVQEQS